MPSIPLASSRAGEVQVTQPELRQKFDYPPLSKLVRSPIVRLLRSRLSISMLPLDKLRVLVNVVMSLSSPLNVLLVQPPVQLPGLKVVSRLSTVLVTELLTRTL